jgi:hypothetical protein
VAAIVPPETKWARAGHGRECSRPRGALMHRASLGIQLIRRCVTLCEEGRGRYVSNATVDDAIPVQGRSHYSLHGILCVRLC